MAPTSDTVTPLALQRSTQAKSLQELQSLKTCQQRTHEKEAFHFLGESKGDQTLRNACYECRLKISLDQVLGRASKHGKTTDQTLSLMETLAASKTAKWVENVESHGVTVHDEDGSEYSVLPDHNTSR